MNIMYTCDNNYVWLMGISTISLFENNKHIKCLNVYLLGENISVNNREKLKKIGEKYNRNIIIIDVPKLNIPNSLISTRWPLSAFTRLYCSQLLPANVKKILYLDCDTIILGDIEELEYVDFNGEIVKGVKDCISGVYKKNIGLEEEDIYINAGVVLFDINALKNININIEIDKYMNKYVKLINYADQDILNGILKGKIGTISPQYNVMTIDTVHNYDEVVKLRRPTNFYSKLEFDYAKSNPRIIHYTTNMLVVRPWFLNTTHPYAAEFEKYKNISVWKGIKYKKMIFSTKESKIIAFIMKFPKNVAYNILGITHSCLKPMYIRMRYGK